MKPNEARKRPSELKKPIFQDDRNAQKSGEQRNILEEIMTKIYK